MNCKFDNSLMRDLTHGLGEGRNYICDECNTHLYKDKWFTRDEWENYVNEVGDTEKILVRGTATCAHRFWDVKRINELTAEQSKQLRDKGYFERKCSEAETRRLRKYAGREIKLGDIADQFFNGVIDGV